MSPSHWGPSTWLFIHTLVSKVKEESFPQIAQILTTNIIKFTYNLPCPECAQHAKEFWKTVNVSNIKSKTDLINIIWVFHNRVNFRRKMPQFKYENLIYYNTKNIINTYNVFANNFNTKGNMSLLNDTFHRNMLLVSLKKWLIKNIAHFEE